MHVLSCFVQFKAFSLISCVFWIFFSERWQSILFQIFFFFFIKTVCYSPDVWTKASKMLIVTVHECVFVLSCPRSGEQRTQKLKSHLVRTQNLNVLPFKPGAGQYIAIHATLTARDFFPAYFYPSGPFTCIVSKTSLNFSCIGCG